MITTDAMQAIRQEGLNKYLFKEAQNELF